MNSNVLSIAGIFGDIADGIAAFMPALAKGILDAFVNLFITTSTTEGVTTYTGLNPLGLFAIVALVIAVCYKILPKAYNFIVKRAAERKARKAAK